MTIEKLLNEIIKDNKDFAKEILESIFNFKIKDKLEEISYSPEKARSGKDIGKPGKQFDKIAKKAGERYGSIERGEKVAGSILAKLRNKHS